MDDFFTLLANRTFCTSTWVRRPEQLDYLEESSDVFHDTFGHIRRRFLDPEFSCVFMQRFGEIGEALRGRDDLVLRLQRLYWFFVEFGFVEQNGLPMVFGAGIMSSHGETHHAWRARRPAEVHAGWHHVDAVHHAENQTTYFLIDDVSEVILGK